MVGVISNDDIPTMVCCWTIRCLHPFISMVLIDISMVPISFLNTTTSVIVLVCESNWFLNTLYNLFISPTYKNPMGLNECPFGFLSSYRYSNLYRVSMLLISS